MFDDITLSLIFSCLLVLSRVGSCLMMLPAISEGYISSRARLFIALGLSVLIVPTVQPLLPKMPQTVAELVLLLAGEVIIGLMIGYIAKIILSALHVAGTVISLQTGLSAATMFDPNQGGQSSLFSGFLTLIAIMLIFSTNLHHVFLYGLVNSYHLFTPGAAIPINDFADFISRTASGSFMIGIQMAAPQLVVGLILYLSAGIMSRLMPQMQVFFVMMPVQIYLGFFILMITLSTSLLLFMEYYSDTMEIFLKK